MEYMTERLIEQVCEEIATVEIRLLMSYALIKAQAKDYIKESQIRIILEPIAERLRTSFSSKKEIEYKLKQILFKLREFFFASPGYGGGNLINLLSQLQINLANLDFSHLTIWQADLRRVNLHHVNFQNTELAKSVFAETLSGVLCVALSPDGKLLATGHNHREIRLWEVRTGKQLLTLEGHTGWVWSVAWSPDGHTLISGGDDNTVRLWDVRDGKCLKVLHGHTQIVLSVGISPDGQIIASGSQDQTGFNWFAAQDFWCVAFLV
jgi:WD40 repeat protein